MRTSALMVAVLLAALPLSEAAQAASTQTGLQIQTLMRAAQGVFIGFTSTPTGCASNYKGFHALVPNTNPAMLSIFATLAMHRATATPVTISYNAPANCGAVSTLLVVTGAQ